MKNIERCYEVAGKVHPKVQAERIPRELHGALGGIETSWIASWRDSICAKAQGTYSLPSYCKGEAELLPKLLTALKQFDSLHGEPITMRAFSSRCYHNSKIFEQEVRDTFIRIAEKYDPELAEICEHASEKGKNESMGVRDNLAFLGIYARPELYELSENCLLKTAFGTIDIGAAWPYGIALPSTAVDSIAGIELQGISTMSVS